MISRLNLGLIVPFKNQVIFESEEMLYVDTQNQSLAAGLLGGILERLKQSFYELQRH